MTGDHAARPTGERPASPAVHRPHRLTGQLTPPGPFPPEVLREYTLLADGERGAVLGPRGDVVWMCAPRWDSGAVFSALIGGRGGYAITPLGRFVWGGYYEPASLIWRSRWVTDGGLTECREALAYPGDPHRAVLLRRIEAVDGDAHLQVTFDPHADYGHAGLTDLHLEAGAWTARSGGLHLRWTGAATIRRDGSGSNRVLRGHLAVPAGTHHDLVLEVSDQPLPQQVPDPDLLWTATEAAWQAAIPDLTSTVAPADTRHAYAVLQGLTSRGGGMVAAATTSLPERAEAGENYDYRYVWIRDQCYTGQAVAAAGPHPLLDQAVSFVGARLLEHGPHLTPAYTVTGGPVPNQRHLGLPGYPGGADIVGNWVNQQFQLDAFGEALLLFAAAAGHDHLDTDGWKAAEAAAAAIAARWTELDAGIWEIDNRAWTHSRLTAAAGLRAIAAAHPAAAHPSLTTVTSGTAASGPAASGAAAQWSALADRIVADTSAHALTPSGHWGRSPDDPALDAALLLPGLRGAVPADDPRTVATLAAYSRDLTVDGYAYRFRHDARPLGQAEGAFLLCGFWMALATHQQGDNLAAVGWFERTRAAAGPPQLFSEEFDIAEHQLRGNLPQAFVHALMLETSARLARP